MKTKDLMNMLAYRRPAGTKTEEAFIKRYIDTIPGMTQDNYGNRILLGPPGSKVIIACHTDTVHKMEGKQRVARKGAIIGLAKKSDSNCLGADDTAGVYACLRMIEAGVKATFIFHRDEEIGGRGSTWLAEKYPDWLKEFDICLSLDRRGTQDIIVHQFGGECASDEFAWSLADALDMGHAPADGIYTDSANYTHLIPECSNLSVGYYNEHSRWETLDIVYLEALIEKLIKVDWPTLTVLREPEEFHYQGANSIAFSAGWSDTEWEAEVRKDWGS